MTTIKATHKLGWKLYSDGRLVSPDGWRAEFPVYVPGQGLFYDRPERIPATIKAWLSRIWRFCQ